MILTLDEARGLVRESMMAHGHTGAEAATIAEHLIDCELRGLGHGGLARAVSVLEHLRTPQGTRGPMKVLRESAVSAQIDGGNQLGYLVAQRATKMAIAKARRSGVAAIGAANTWSTGMLSYYLEQATSAGFVGIVAGRASSLGAPRGASEPGACIDPVGFGFPATDSPVIWDSGSCGLACSEASAGRPGQPLPQGGFALSIRLLAMLAGQGHASTPTEDCGFFIVAVDPGLFGEPGEFPQRVSEFAAMLKANRPCDAQEPVDLPFARSAAERRRRLAEDRIEVADGVVQALRQACRLAA